MAARRSPESVEAEIHESRPHITLDYSTYRSRHKKARFIDREFGEYWMTPGNALQGQEHPARKQEKINKTNQARYGVDNPMLSPEIQERVKESNRKKFGSDFYMQTEEFKEKSQATCREKWGADKFPVHQNESYQYEDHSDKVRNGVLKKYGVTSTALVPEIKAKQVATCQERYGGDTSLASPEVRKKQAITRKSNNKFEESFHKCFPELDRNRWFSINGKNYELDFYDARRNVGIELCGEYWHSDKFIHKRKHLEKLMAFKSIDIQVIFIFQQEWRERRKQVESFVGSKLGKFDRIIGARKTQTALISNKEAAEFCEQNHIQGATSGNSCNVALTLESEIVGVACFGPGHRQQNQHEWFLKRLCFSPGVRINGGVDKMLKRFSHHTGESRIFTFIDKRFSVGDSFIRNGWKVVKDNNPDYFYFDGRKHVSKQSRKKSNVNTPQTMTEFEHAQLDGLVRVWDCGKFKLEKTYD